jgi:hypothetical protein
MNTFNHKTKIFLSSYFAPMFVSFLFSKKKKENFSKIYLHFIYIGDECSAKMLPIAKVVSLALAPWAVQKQILICAAMPRQPRQVQLLLLLATFLTTLHR